MRRRKVGRKSHAREVGNCKSDWKDLAREKKIIMGVARLVTKSSGKISTEVAIRVKETRANDVRHFEKLIGEKRYAYG